MKKQRMTRSKKNPFTAGIALLAILSLVSCTQEDTLPGDNDGSMPALAVTTLQATDIDVSKAATRVVSTTDYPTANSIGFFLKADAANGYVACNNRKGEYNAARKLWLPTPDSIWLNSHNADIAVYAPYDAAHTTAATLNLAAALRPADGSKDIWCKHITANNKSKNLSVILEHVYTRLALTVTRDANYKAEAVLSALSLKGDEIYESATYKPFETTPYTYSTTTGLTPTVAEQTLNASTASATYDLLLIPTPLTGDITLTLTVDGKKMETIIDKTRFADSKLDAGKQYNIDLALKPGKLEIASVSLVKWDALPEINGGQAEFDIRYIGTEINMPELDFIFARGNLYYDKVNNKYQFAANQGEMNIYDADPLKPEKNNGWYFCWNTISWDNAIYNPGAYVETPDETTQYGDPCQLMGTEWHTPSEEDLKSILAKVSPIKAGVFNFKMNGEEYSTPGCWYGTDAAEVKEKDYSKYLFIPAMGYQNNGNNTEIGTRAPIWSRTGNGAGCGYCTYMRNVGTGAPTVQGLQACYATGVRCIKYKPKPKPAHAIEVEGLDFYVADGNVVATKQATGEYTYKFADEQGYYNANDSYFCWNTLDPSETIYHYSSWDNARDVCRQIGDKQWYTPTEAQLQKLVDLYTGNKTVEGTYTMSDNTTVNGRYFGTATAPSPAVQNKYVFLPLTKVRNGHDGSYRNSSGYRGSMEWWNGDGPILELYNNNSNDNVCQISGYSKDDGCPIRCVHDK